MSKRQSVGNFDIDEYIGPILPSPWLHHLPRFISRFLGYREHGHEEPPDVLIWLWTWIGVFCGVAAVEAVFRTSYFMSHGVPAIVGSFGATAVLLYGSIDSPFAQPRNIFFGHTISAIIGVIVTQLFLANPSKFAELNWLAGAIASATAAVFMAITKTTHPPAGATAMFAVSQPSIVALGWYYVPLIMLWSVLSIAIGLITNNIQRQYPFFWVTASDLPLRKAANKLGSQGESTDDLIKRRNSFSSDMSFKSDGESSKSDENSSIYDGEFTKEDVVIVTGTGVTVPNWLPLQERHRKALEEIQKMLDKDYTTATVPLQKEFSLPGTTGGDEWYRGPTWEIDIV